MTLKEAYIAAKNKGAEIGRTRLSSCRDFGAFWGFVFIKAVGVTGDDGGCHITINKETGEIGYFIPPMDLDLARSAKPIPIEQFAEVA